MTTNRDNSYRDWQKITAHAVRAHRANRVNMPPRVKYYFQPDKNRLWICHHQEQSLELKKLCGKLVRHVSAAWVALRRLHDPFIEELALSK